MARHHTRTSRFLLGLCSCFLVLAVYVLSIGPVKRLERGGYLPSKPVEAFYQPLSIVNGTPLESALIWYLELWFPPSYIGDLPGRTF